MQKYPVLHFISTCIQVVFLIVSFSALIQHELVKRLNDSVRAPRERLLSIFKMRGLIHFECRSQAARSGLCESAIIQQNGVWREMRS
jgi:hypothetical protein